LDFIICSAWLYCCAARGGIGVESAAAGAFAAAVVPLAVAALPWAAAAPAAVLAALAPPAGAPFEVTGFDSGVLAGAAGAGARDGFTGAL
jgi:hypothetical protein